MLQLLPQEPALQLCLTCIRITGAIGTLRGPLHGGANEAAMEMIEQYSTRDEAKAGVLDLLAKKEKIMGFGHAV